VPALVAAGVLYTHGVEPVDRYSSTRTAKVGGQTLQRLTCLACMAAEDTELLERNKTTMVRHGTREVRCVLLRAVEGMGHARQRMQTAPLRLWGRTDGT
jgi:hypothetical protein